MSKSIKFSKNIFVDISNIIKNKKQIGWIKIEWSGNSTGGKITTNVNLLNKLVCLVFISNSNSAHYCYTTLYWLKTNNYLIASLYNQVQHIVANITTDNSFNLIIPNTIKLNDIYYLNI